MTHLPIVAALVALVSELAPAQCPERWVSEGCPGVNSTVTSIVRWDPDGPGPRAPLIVVGGVFTQAGASRINALAAWNPETRTWSGFGILGGWIRCMDVSPSGEIVVAGDIELPGGRAAVASWNGAAWRVLATSVMITNFDGDTDCLRCAPDGSVVIGGLFFTVDGVDARSVARWTPQGWQPIGAGSTGEVFDLEIRANGFIVAIGDFGMYGGPVWQWNGLQWINLGGPATSSVTTRLALLPQGQIAATAGDSVYRFDGSHWTRMGGAFQPRYPYSSASLTGLSVTPAGQVVVSGNFVSVSGTPVAGIAEWDGTAWTDIGDEDIANNRFMYFLGAPGSDQLYAAGFFRRADGRDAWSIAVREAKRWKPLSREPDRAPRAFVELPTGEIIAAGDIRMVDGIPAGGVVRFDGICWRPVGQGMDGTVHALARAGDGVIYAGGEFTQADGGNASNIARWDGASWTALGAGLDGPVLALAVPPGGGVVAAGRFTGSGGLSLRRVARWDGSAWHPMGDGIDGSADPYVVALQTLPDGSLAAAGRFDRAGAVPASNIARWDGQAWAALGAGLDDRALCLARLPGGDLLAGGFFTHAGGTVARCIARWDGAAWSPVGSDAQTQYIYSLATLSSGEILAGRWILYYDTIGFYSHGVWTTLPDFNGQARTMLTLSTDDVIIGGPFIQVGDLETEFVARRTHTPSCYANCDCSANPPMLNVLDMTCFVNHFAAGNLYANCDHSTSPPVLNVLDFNCFLNAFTAGCP